MRIEILKVERVCAKCHKSSDMGHVFNDKQRTIEGTRVWEVFMCSECLANVVTKKGGENHEQEK